MAKQKQNCHNFVNSLKVKKTEISTLHKSSYTLTQYLTEAPLQPQVFLGMIWEALHIRIWQLSAILLISSRLKLCQVGWGQMHIFRFLQKYLFAFKPRLWLGHSRTFTELSISHSCCVFRSIVLLEGEPSAQSEVLNALDWDFIKAISIFWVHWAFLLLWRFTQSLLLKNSPTAWGCYQYTLLLGWYSAGDEQFLVSFKHDVWNWGSSDSESEGPLGAFLQIPGVFSCVFTEERIASGHTSIKPRLVECCSDVCPSVGFPSGSWSPL